MLDKILILDFGSQTTQLIARRIRDLGVYCEVHPYHHIPAADESLKGIIHISSPYSISQPEAFKIDLKALPSTTIRYLLRSTVHREPAGGKVEPSASREYVVEYI